MTFDVGAELAVSVDQNSLRSARSTIEDELQDATVGVDAGGSSLPGGGAIADGGVAAAGGAGILDALDEQTEWLQDIHDVMEQSAVSAGGGGGVGSLLPGGGGGLGGLVGGVSFGALVSKVSLKSLLTKAPAFATLVTAASLSDDLVTGTLGPDDIVDSSIKLGDIMTFGLSPNDFVSGTIGAATLVAGTVQISNIIGGALSGTALGGYLGSVGMGTLLNPLTGSVVALLGGAISLADLVDGDISSWNLPAKFGQALGQGFENQWPNIADQIQSGFTSNPFYEFGKEIREGFENPEQSKNGFAKTGANDSTAAGATDPGDGTDIESGTVTGPSGTTDRIAEMFGIDVSQSSSANQAQSTQNRAAQQRPAVVEVNENLDVRVEVNETLRQALRDEGLDPKKIDRIVREYDQTFGAGGP